jgi:hypothetical protein
MINFVEFRVRQARTSFLKKRSKKLLVLESVRVKRPVAPNGKSFLVTFFQKSNVFLPMLTGAMRWV